MSKNDQRKNEALGLYRSGLVPSKIAARMGVSVRTVQRWLKDETPVPVRVAVMEADKDAHFPPPRNTATNCDKFDLTLSRRMAIRLLNLSEAALNAVEDTLSDPDARRADKLRAAKLVGDWLGIGSAARHPSGLFVSIPERLEEVFAVKLASDPHKERSALSIMLEGGEDDED